MEHVAVNPLDRPFDKILIQVSLEIELISLHLAGRYVGESYNSIFLHDVSGRLKCYVVRLLHESILRHW